MARALLGDDMVFDFDMMIYKAPHTDTDVPWHQDQAYWLDMPDKRALSCWVSQGVPTGGNQIEDGLLRHMPDKRALSCCVRHFASKAFPVTKLM